ncbi:MAG TPA: hypothetical protein VHU40_20655 [Polyangia bacterium]|nr:hypothetical protein [Polyangia bacterium]
MRSRAVALALVSMWAARAASAAPPPAPAPEPAATFALILGVNASLDPDVPPLQYADDDAARYLDLFRALGARTYLLTRLDQNTRRIHVQAAAEALPPRLDDLRRAVAAAARDVAQARARGLRTQVYVVYAGHGELRDGVEQLTLEDGRLTSASLLHDVIEPIGGDQAHLIADACHASLLAMARGPGGTRRPVNGFVELEAASRAGRLGFLLASSVGGESHEWEGFQSGVFSHEVRSGLYGAADADGDGRVSYAEIAAFVERANAAIVNQRFWPQVLARPPRDSDTLLDLRGRNDRAVVISGADAAAHYLLEDERGVRLLDFHGTGAQDISLVRPTAPGTLYLRRTSDGAERAIPPRDGVVRAAELQVRPPRVQARGALHVAFGQLFSLPFDASDVTSYQQRTDAAEASLRATAARQAAEDARARTRRIIAWTSVGVAAGAAAGATAALVSAHRIRDAAPAQESQRDAVARNERIDGRNRLGGALVAVAAGAVGAGLWLFLAGDGNPADPPVQVGLAPTSIDIAARVHF